MDANIIILAAIAIPDHIAHIPHGIHGITHHRAFGKAAEIDMPEVLVSGGSVGGKRDIAPRHTIVDAIEHVHGGCGTGRQGFGVDPQRGVRIQRAFIGIIVGVAHPPHRIGFIHRGPEVGPGAITPDGLVGKHHLHGVFDHRAGGKRSEIYIPMIVAVAESGDRHRHGCPYGSAIDGIHDTGCGGITDRLGFAIDPDRIFLIDVAIGGKMIGVACPPLHTATVHDGEVIRAEIGVPHRAARPETHFEGILNNRAGRKRTDVHRPPLIRTACARIPHR